MKHPLSLVVLLLLFGCQPPVQQMPEGPPPEDWSTLSLSEAPALSDRSMLNPPGWERRNTAFYHVWVSSFADGPDADTTGDLVGLRGKLEAGYFQDLGVNALWLSPIFRATSLSPSSENKHGYDTINYDEVDPLYGTIDDLGDLLDSAHQRGIRVIFDFVPNHTSDQSPWFSTKKDWFVVRDSKPAGWGGFDNNSDWYTYPHAAGGFYYGVFWSGMPDLNYHNPEVRNEMASVVSRWLNFGFDGLRVDAVKYLVEGSANGQWKDQPETYLWFQALRSLVLEPHTALGSSKFMVAENWTSDPDNLRSYLEKDGKPAFSMTFDFDWPWWVTNRLSGDGTTQEVADLRAALVDRASLLPSGTTFGTFQSNHDNVAHRPASSYSGADRGPKLFLAAALSFLGQGTPFVYYGNETGQTGEAGDDIELRQSLDWTRVTSQQADPDSLWNWHASLLKLRAASPAWDDPRLSSLGSPAGTLAWLVTGRGGQRAVVAANLKRTATSSVTISGLSGDLSLARTVLGSGQPQLGDGGFTLSNLPAFGLRVVSLDEADPLVVRDTDGTGAYAPPPIVYPTLFLRGSMNQWGTTALIDLGNGHFHQSFTATASGEVLFKFGTPDWGTTLGFTEMAHDPNRGGLPADEVTGVTDGFAGWNVRFLAVAGTTYDLHLDTNPQPPSFWVLTTP